MAARGLDISALDREVMTMPAARYNLSYFVQKHAPRIGNYAARDAWYRSYEDLMRIYAEDKAMQDQINSELSDNEKRVIDYMRTQREQIRTRRQEAMHQLVAGLDGETIVYKFMPFSTPEEAFPHALFTRYTLNSLKDGNNLDVPENEKDALSALVNGNVNLLAQLWLDDLAYAWSARPDLRNQIMDGLSKSEKEAMRTYIRKGNAIIAKNQRISALRTYQEQLDTLKGLDPEAHKRFQNQIIYSELKAIPEILMKAEELAALTEAAKGDKVKLNAILNAYLEQLYSNDEQMSKNLDENEEEFKSIEDEDVPLVSDKEIETYIDRNPNTTSEDAKTAILYQKIAEEATRAANAAAEEDDEATFAPEAKADEDTQPENSVGLGGDIRYKRGARNSDAPNRTSVEAHLTEVTSDWESKPRFEVYYNPEQIQDPEVRARLTSRLEGDKIAGAIDPETGIVYIFSQQIQDLDHAAFTLFHELYGHWGMRYFLGKSLDTFLQNQYRLNKEVKAEADRQFDEAAANGETMSRLESIEEAISDIAANGDPSLFRQIVGRLIKFLRDHGMNDVADWMDQSGKSELAYVLSQARKAVRTQQGHSPLAYGKVAYSRNKPYELFSERDGKLTGYARLHPATQRWTVFTIKNAETNEYTTYSTDELGDAYAALKKIGTVTKSRDRETRRDTSPQNIKKIPDQNDVTGIRKFWRNMKLSHVQQYLPIFEVARWMNGHFEEQNTVEDDLVKYESRMMPFIRRFEKDYLVPLKNLLSEAGKKGATLEDVEEFLLARHAKERNDHINKIDPKKTDGSGMTTKEAKMLLKSMKDGQWNAYQAELKKIGSLFDRMSKDKLNYMLSTGLISKHTYKALSDYKHYVALNGNETKGLPANSFGASHMTLKGASLIRSTGRGTRAVDVIANTLNGYSSAIILGQKNRVRQSILSMVEQNPDPSFVTVEPIKEKKRVDAERLKFDNKILRTIGDGHTEKSGREYLASLLKRMEDGEIDSDGAMDEFAERIGQAIDMRDITREEGQRAVRSLTEAVIFSGRLTPDGYVHYVEDPTLIHDQSVIVAKVNGNQVMMKFDDRAAEFVAAITGTNKTERSWLTNLTGGWNRIFSEMVTSKNPAWILPNMVKDFQTAFANAAADPKVGTKLANKMRKEWGTSWRIAWRYTIDENADEGAGFWGKFFANSAKTKPLDAEERALIQEFLDEGGGTYFLDRKGMESTTELLNRYFTPQKLLGIRSLEDMRFWTSEKFDGIGRVLDVLGSPGELACRLSIYKVLREEGWTKAEASRYAKELTTDFNAKGTAANVRGMYAFFQPTINGTVRMFKDAMNGKVPAKQFTKVAGFFFLLGVLSNLLSRATGDDDKDKPGVDALDKVSNHDRTTKFILMPNVPGMAIPIAYGWNVFLAAGHYSVDVMINKLSALEAAGRVVASAFDSFSPIGSGMDSKSGLGKVVKTVTPTPFVPAVEMVMNENTFGAPITKGGNIFQKYDETDAYLHFDSANPISKSMMHGLAQATSGGRNPRYTEALIDWNPGNFDHLVSSYLPGLINEGYKLAGTAVNVAQGRNVKESALPIVGRFQARVNEDSFNQGAYNRTSEMVKSLIAEVNAPDTSVARRAEILKKYPRLPQAADLMTSTDNAIKKAQKDLQVLERSPQVVEKFKVERRNLTENYVKNLRAKALKGAISAGFRDAVLDNNLKQGIPEQVGAIISQ
jgi:hypothetical protein